MQFIELKKLVISDLYRYTGKISKKYFFKHLVVTPGFKYTFLLRVKKYSDSSFIKKILLKPFIYVLHNHYSFKYGISISSDTVIGPGFYIGHYGGIVINNNAIIGNNCNISHGVTIGQVNRGKRKGCPTIGNNVYIGPGAKLFGKIQIGNNVAIGANCVATKDAPENAVIAGIPGEVLSLNGSDGYINRTDYPI